MLMQNFVVTNKEHYGMLWYFWSGQLIGQKRQINFSLTGVIIISINILIHIIVSTKPKENKQKTFSPLFPHCP